MSYYTPPVIVGPLRARPLGSVLPAPNPSLPPVPSPMVSQQQIPQYTITTTTAPIPIPATTRNSIQQSSYVQRPHYGAQSLPMYIQQPQHAGYPVSGYTPGYTYGTPATQYVPGSAGRPYVFVQGGPSSPHRHHRSSGHRHNWDLGYRLGHHCHRRHRTYSDPEYDYRYRRH